MSHGKLLSAYHASTPMSSLPPDPGNPSLDGQLRALHAAGDHERVATLGLEHHGAELLRFAHALLRTPDAAQDAFGTVCEKIWTGLPAFRFDCSFRSWAFLITRRVCLELLRHPRVHRAVPLSAAGPLSEIAEQVRTRTLPFLRTDVKDRLRALRESLTPDEQALLTLRLDRGLSWSEIADVLNEPACGADEGERRRRIAALRKRFERLKERLRQRAVNEGLLER